MGCLARNVMITTGVILGCVVGAETGEYGAVRVVVYDTLGVRLDDATVTARDSKGALIALDKPIPHGRYSIRAEAKYHQPWERSIEVRESQVFIAVGLAWKEFGDPAPARLQIVGSLTGARLSSSAIARAVSALGDFTKESMVSPSGQFRFDWLPSGIYVIYVLDGERVVGYADAMIGPEQSTARISIIHSRSSREKP